MLTWTITTRNDLTTWAQNVARLDEYLDLLDAIENDEHPRWGSDWTDYLGSIDVAATVEARAVVRK